MRSGPCHLHHVTWTPTHWVSAPATASLSYSSLLSNPGSLLPRGYGHVDYPIWNASFPPPPQPDFSALNSLGHHLHLLFQEAFPVPPHPRLLDVLINPIPMTLITCSVFFISLITSYNHLLIQSFSNESMCNLQSETWVCLIYLESSTMPACSKFSVSICWLDE